MGQLADLRQDFLTMSYEEMLNKVRTIRKERIYRPTTKETWADKAPRTPKTKKESTTPRTTPRAAPRTAPDLDSMIRNMSEAQRRELLAALGYSPEANDVETV